MDAPGKALKKRARNRGRALKASRGNVARQAVKSRAGSAGKKRVTLHLPVNKWRELKVLATMLDTTMDALMRSGLDLALAERKTRQAARISAAKSDGGDTGDDAEPRVSLRSNRATS
jgi:hypothetical protein